MNRRSECGSAPDCFAILAFSRSIWRKAKRTILARSPSMRDSSVTASRRSMGRRSVIPGRSSVHRCPSWFTFRTAFFAAFSTGTGCPSMTSIAMESRQSSADQLPRNSGFTVTAHCARRGLHAPSLRFSKLGLDDDWVELGGCRAALKSRNFRIRVGLQQLNRGQRWPDCA